MDGCPPRPSRSHNAICWVPVLRITPPTRLMRASFASFRHPLGDIERETRQRHDRSTSPYEFPQGYNVLDFFDPNAGVAANFGIVKGKPFSGVLLPLDAPLLNFRVRAFSVTVRTTFCSFSDCRLLHQTRREESGH